MKLVVLDHLNMFKNWVFCLLVTISIEKSIVFSWKYGKSYKQNQSQSTSSICPASHLPFTKIGYDFISPLQTPH